MDKDLLLIGKVSKPHGIRGNVKVVSYADSADTYRDIAVIYLKEKGGAMREIHINSISSGGRAIILGFDGIGDRGGAEEITGCELYVDRSTLTELPEGEYYHFNLIGLNVVTTDGIDIGKISEIIETGSNDVFVVKKGKSEHLIPAIKGVVKDVDLEKGDITIEPMEGMIEGL